MIYLSNKYIMFSSEVGLYFLYISSYIVSSGYIFIVFNIIVSFKYFNSGKHTFSCPQNEIR